MPVAAASIEDMAIPDPLEVMLPKVIPPISPIIGVEDSPRPENSIKPGKAAGRNRNARLSGTSDLKNEANVRERITANGNMVISIVSSQAIFVYLPVGLKIYKAVKKGIRRIMKIRIA